MNRAKWIGITGLMMLAAGITWAQGPQRAAAEEVLRIRRLTGLGPRARATTPVFQTNVGGGIKRPQDWQVIAVVYDTAPEWMDDLLVQFFVITARPDPQTKQSSYSLFKKAVRYGDIERGRDHRAEAFLRPVALRRFGEVVACAVVFTLDGKVVAETSEQSMELREHWWRDPQIIDSPRLPVREGYLLNRNETPWAAINTDDVEVIK